MQPTALEDLAIGGNQVKRGERLWLMLWAANRDPAVFPNPDVLDFAHPHHRHIVFGIGIHFCIGAGLARLEGQNALATILGRLGRIRLEDNQP